MTGRQAYEKEVQRDGSRLQAIPWEELPSDRRKRWEMIAWLWSYNTEEIIKVLLGIIAHGEHHIVH